MKTRSIDASFDPSGTRLVTAGDDATVRIWSASDGAQLTVLDRLPSPAVAALFTPDGRDVIAAARDGTIVRWDAATGRRRATCRAHHPDNGNWVESMALSPQGTTLALAGQRRFGPTFRLVPGWTGRGHQADGRHGHQWVLRGLRSRRPLPGGHRQG